MPRHDLFRPGFWRNMPKLFLPLEKMIRRNSPVWVPWIHIPLFYLWKKIFSKQKIKSYLVFFLFQSVEILKVVEWNWKFFPCLLLETYRLVLIIFTMFLFVCLGCWRRSTRTAKQTSQIWILSTAQHLRSPSCLCLCDSASAFAFTAFRIGKKICEEKEQHSIACFAVGWNRVFENLRARSAQSAQVNRWRGLQTQLNCTTLESGSSLPGLPPRGYQACTMRLEKNVEGTRIDTMAEGSRADREAGHQMDRAVDCMPLPSHLQTCTEFSSGVWLRGWNC